MTDNNSPTLTKLAISSKGQDGDLYLGELMEQLSPEMDAIARSWERSTGIDREDFLWAMWGKVFDMVDKFQGGAFKSFARRCFINACHDYAKGNRGQQWRCKHNNNPVVSLDCHILQDDVDIANHHEVMPATETTETIIGELELKKILAAFAEAYEKDGKIVQLIGEGYTYSEVSKVITGVNDYNRKMRLAVYHARNRFAEYLVKQGHYDRGYVEVLRKAG
jgi:DNA-directed RNA polymerase specialized sigma24 family protein